MRMTPDFISRIKIAGQRTPHGFGEDTGRVLKLWIVILLWAAALLITFGCFAAYRFYYWSDFEERMIQEGLDGDMYDEATIKVILTEYEKREDAVTGLLEMPVEEKGFNDVGIE